MLYLVITNNRCGKKMTNNNSTQETINKVVKTIFVGLPAVGKSTMSNELCRLVKEKTGIALESTSSDLKFREVRKNAKHTVVQKFMKDNNIPASDFHLLIKTSDFIKKYGEPVFRDLESAVIVDMIKNGEFDGKIPNLGAKAMLHPQTASAFKRQGYTVVYLTSDTKIIAEHISRDFEAMLDGATITRSPINNPIMDKLKHQFPNIASKSPKSFIAERCQRLKNLIQGKPQPLEEIHKFNKKLQKESQMYNFRLETRNQEALDIITKRSSRDDKLYKNVADVTVYLTNNLKENVNIICKTLGIDNLSSNANTNAIPNYCAHKAGRS